MKISEIKDKELRELAELRRSEGSFPYSDYLSLAFCFDTTPERFDFWLKVIRLEVTELNPLNELVIDDLALENKLLKEKVRSLEALLKAV